MKTIVSLTNYGERYAPLVRGEATASYAAMPPELISEVTTLNPDIKVIIMLRDPVSRAWSHAKKDLVRSRNRSARDVPFEEFKAFFQDDYQVACGTYSAMIANWTTALKPGHLFLGHFDDVSKNPEYLLLSIFSFLGVRSGREYLTRFARVRVNTTEGDIPERHRAFLEELFVDQTALLERTYKVVAPPISSKIENPTPVLGTEGTNEE